MNQAYDIEAHWIINLICNYDCEYCFSRAPQDPDLVGKLTPQAYLDFFDSTGKTWLLHITGGEPLAYRGLAELCATLTRRHLISLNSNLALTRVTAFAKAVDPERVHFIHCGIHIEERDKHNGWTLLLNNLRELVQAGFPVFASSVMTPEAFPLFEDARARLDDAGVPLIPKIIRGMFRERQYPQSYSALEREQFLQFAAFAEQKILDSPHAPFRHDPTINPLIDRHFLDGVRDFTGVACSAGRRFVTIATDGNIYACGTRGRIGNIFQRRIEFFAGDRPCRSDWCHYACVRYSERDVAGAQSLPMVPAEPTLKNRMGNLLYLLERGAVNTLVRLSVR